MIMLYPSCIIISHVGPSIWLPACEVSRILFDLLVSRKPDKKLPGNLGYTDLLFIHGHRRETGKNHQLANPSHLTLTILYLGLWTSVSYRIFRRRDLARLFYHHQVNSPLHVNKQC
jgi:hypothetical protein